MLKDFKKHFKTSEIHNTDFEKHWNLFDQIADKKIEKVEK